MVENVSYSLSDRAPILEQINEHYGTSFTGWSDNEIGLSIGDTVPSWAEYEKIYFELKFATSVTDGTSNFIFGKVKSTDMEIVVDQNQQMYFADLNGNIMSARGGSFERESFQNFLKNRFSTAGVSIETFSGKVESFEVGQQINDWESYQKI